MERERLEPYNHTTTIQLPYNFSKPTTTPSIQLIQLYIYKSKRCVGWMNFTFFLVKNPKNGCIGCIAPPAIDFGKLYESCMSCIGPLDSDCK